MVSVRTHPGQALDASEEPGILPGSEREAVDGNAIADAEPPVEVGGREHTASRGRSGGGATSRRPFVSFR
jgi:hypothetical protein